jgi:hypothetical protein
MKYEKITQICARISNIKFDQNQPKSFCLIKVTVVWARDAVQYGEPYTALIFTLQE